MEWANVLPWRRNRCQRLRSIPLGRQRRLGRCTSSILGRLVPRPRCLGSSGIRIRRLRFRFRSGSCEQWEKEIDVLYYNIGNNYY